MDVAQIRCIKSRVRKKEVMMMKDRVYCKKCGENRKVKKELEFANSYYAELECGHYINF